MEVSTGTTFFLISISDLKSSRQRTAKSLPFSDSLLSQVNTADGNFKTALKYELMSFFFYVKCIEYQMGDLFLLKLRFQ